MYMTQNFDVFRSPEYNQENVIFETPLESAPEVVQAYNQNKPLRFSLNFKGNQAPLLKLWILKPTDFENNHIAVDKDGFFNGITGYIGRIEGVDSFIGEKAPIGIQDTYTNEKIGKIFYNFLSSY